MNSKGPVGGRQHTIHRHQQQLAWDNAIAPAQTIAPGDVVVFKDIDATCGQITAQSTADVLNHRISGASIRSPVRFTLTAPSQVIL